MYKNYRIWHRDNYGSAKEPLSFREWLQWAKNKKYVRTQNANGAPTQPTQPTPSVPEIQKESVVVEETVKPIKDRAKIMGQRLAFTLAVFIAIGIGVAAAKAK